MIASTRTFSLLFPFQSEGLLRSFCLLLALMVCAQVKANDNTERRFIISEQTQGKFAGKYLAYLEDKDFALTFEQIQSGELDHQFSNSKVDVPNLGFSKSRYWLRLRLEDASSQSGRHKTNHWILEYVYPPMDNIVLYYPNSEGSYSQLINGEFTPIHQRDYQHYQYLFELETQPGNSFDLYFRVDGDGSMQFPIKLWTLNSFVNYDSKRTLVNGLFYGIMFVMAAYNLFLFFSVRDNTYLYYIGYIISVAFYFGSFSGLSQAYVWPNFPNFSAISIPFWAGVGLVFSIFFSRNFLSTQKNIPKIDKALNFFLLSSVVSISLCLFDQYYLAVLTVVFSGVTFSATILAGSIICWVQHHKAARFFTIAWGALLVGLVLQGLAVMSIIPVNFITMHFAQIGSALEVILLSFALADRINVLRYENQSYQRQSLAALEKSNLLKDQFLATISHELRTPMNGIQSSLSLINNKELSNENKDLITVANQSSEHMLNLIDGILDFTEAQSNRVAIHKEAFFCLVFFEAISRKAQTQAKEKSIDFQLIFSDQLPEQIISDEKLLRKALLPLIDNAIKFTNKGHIELRLGYETVGETSQLNIDLEDTGIGVAEEKIEEIFNEFQQQDGSFHRDYGGLGIGLSTSKRIIELLGGEFKFHSQIQRGTQVHLTIPITLPIVNSTKESNTKIEEKSSSQSTASPAGEASLLVVEDNLVNQKVLVKMLSKLGFNADVVNNGKEAVTYLENKFPDMILMDCQMPVMDGFEATQAIRAIGKGAEKIPIVAVTANAMSCDRDKCLDSGMNDYMTKPIKLDLLKEKLSQWLPAEKHSLSA